MAKAAQEFAEIWAETLQANRYLRWLTIGLCAALLFVIAHAFQLAWQPPPKPLIIRVDEVGRAEAVNYEAVEAQAKPLDATTKYFLHRFIADHYTRRAATVRDHWARSLLFLATPLANAAFDRDSQAIALTAAGGNRYETTVENILLRIQPKPQEPHEATADFDQVRTEQGREIDRKRWSVSLQFTFLQEIPSSLIVHNPMGIIIVYLQVDEALGAIER